MTELEEFIDEHDCITRDLMYELADESEENRLKAAVLHGMTIHPAKGCDSDVGEVGEYHIPSSDVKSILIRGEVFD